MTLQSFFWLLLGCWALAIVAAVLKLAFDVLDADARNAKPPAGWFPSTVRIYIYCGAVLTSILVFSTIHKSIGEIWSLGLAPFSHDLAAYSGPVELAVLSIGVFVGLAMLTRSLERLLDRILPESPATRTPTAENRSDRRAANGR